MENISEAHKVCKYAQEKKLRDALFALNMDCVLRSFYKSTSSAQAAQQYGCTSAIAFINAVAKENDELQKQIKQR